MKLILVYFVLTAFITISYGQETKNPGLCSNLDYANRPTPIDCPHSSKNCPEYYCVDKCEPICVYLKNINSFVKYQNKCVFCQKERCKRNGAFEVPLTFCNRRMSSYQLKDMILHDATDMMTGDVKHIMEDDTKDIMSDFARDMIPEDVKEKKI